jgi:putative transcriptional regulator
MSAKLLVSAPNLTDPFFGESVVLLLHHDKDGATGIIINKSIPADVGNVAPPLRACHVDNLLFGGPMDHDTGTILTSEPLANPAGIRVGEGLYLSRAMSTLHKIIKRDGQFWLALGSAGWGPKQLDKEIAQGDWVTAPLDIELILSMPLSERYPTALAMVGLNEKSVLYPAISV